MVYNGLKLHALLALLDVYVVTLVGLFSLLGLLLGLHGYLKSYELSYNAPNISIKYPFSLFLLHIRYATLLRIVYY